MSLPPPCEGWKRIPTRASLLSKLSPCPFTPLPLQDFLPDFRITRGDLSRAPRKAESRLAHVRRIKCHSHITRAWRQFKVLRWMPGIGFGVESFGLLRNLCNLRIKNFSILPRRPDLCSLVFIRGC